jgi:hypothetical protein
MTLTRGAPDSEDRLGTLLHGTAPALVVGDRVITHADLDALVVERAAALGPTRRLVLLECANALEPLVTYLAALRGRHPVLLLPALDGTPAQRQWQRTVASYRPDFICTRQGESWTDTEVCRGTSHDLHPDLAVLLGTSGSTGTPKMVRLSRENLRSNAAAIASSLRLDATSRAATTLPMQYCYGLSVVNSHLHAGGSIWLTEASVVDPGFWDAFARAGATSFAGVPYTFELLARSGVDWLAQHGLRLVTQAGGRLAPETVRELALRSGERGVDFVVMYGQTEATARMAYLPPALAADRPACIGISIDGGELRIDDGELVYSGPNVMLGYAERPTDLALGPTLTELRTGDLAVQHDDGLFEIVGRRSRIAKLYGVRLDLELGERMLAARDLDARLVVADERLHVFVRGKDGAGEARDLVAAEHCLPAHAVCSQLIDEFPQTPNGKPDLSALERLATTAPTADEPADVRAAYAGVFGAEVDDDDTFQSLRGDSLSYVETFTRLERLLGTVPANWPQLTIAELSGSTRGPRRFWAALETPLVLRALAILLLVGAHVDLWTVQGGAHVLLAVYGYNLARFALTAPTPRDRLVAVLRSIGDMLAPAAVVVVGVIAFRGTYDWPTLLMVNHVVGDHDHWSPDWQLWFLEAATWTAALGAVVLGIPGVRSMYLRRPFAVAVTGLGFAMLLRGTTLPTDGPMHLYSPQATAWCILLGVVAAFADTPLRRTATATLAVTCTLGFFEAPVRGYLVIGAVLLMLAVPRIPIPRPVDHIVTAIASASLFIYITHWQIYPELEASGHQGLALVASVAVGLAAWWLWAAGRRTLLPRRPRGSRNQRATPWTAPTTHRHTSLPGIASATGMPPCRRTPQA